MTDNLKQVLDYKCPQSGDRDTNTYDVAFTDSQGEQRRTRCKIRRFGWFGDGEVYWRDPV